ncbi:MAG: LamG domain-containing protein [Armatimonadota bacterium]
MRSSMHVLLVVALSACAAFAQAPAPVAYWSMDEVADGVVADVSGNGHDATAHGADDSVPEVIPGVVGDALRFQRDLEQYLLVENGEGLQAPEAMTVMAWIRPAQRQGAHEIIGNKGDKSGEPPWPGWRLRYFWARLILQYGTADGEEPQVSTENWSIDPGFWHHVAVTYDGERLAAYINCTLSAEVEVDAPIMPRDRSFVIGNYPGRKNAYAFDGAIDELKVFDGALTLDEIFAEAVDGMPE